MGKLWKDEELLQLLKEIKGQMAIQDIATAHKRTAGGIISRLRSLAVDYHINDSKSVNEIMIITGLPKDDIIDAINKREYRDEIKAKKKSEEHLSTILIKSNRSESSELQEILILLKSIDKRITDYINEKTIFGE